ncbi:hypothetical protein FPQ18DRAFT_415077 [Pyronema domesticum]|nr:hypothetical protein FPQ18DRAFT_415077 [Pyronema domesticum]
MKPSAQKSNFFRNSWIRLAVEFEKALLHPEAKQTFLENGSLPATLENSKLFNDEEILLGEDIHALLCYLLLNDDDIYDEATLQGLADLLKKFGTTIPVLESVRSFGYTTLVCHKFKIFGLTVEYYFPVSILPEIRFVMDSVRKITHRRDLTKAETYNQDQRDALHRVLLKVIRSFTGPVKKKVPRKAVSKYGKEYKELFDKGDDKIMKRLDSVFKELFEKRRNKEPAAEWALLVLQRFTVEELRESFVYKPNTAESAEEIVDTAEEVMDCQEDFMDHAEELVDLDIVL